jgi:hypothetical protein
MLNRNPGGEARQATPMIRQFNVLDFEQFLARRRNFEDLDPSPDLFVTRLSLGDQAACLPRLAAKQR